MAIQYCGTGWTLHTPEVEISSSKRDKILLELALKQCLEGSSVIEFDFGRKTTLSFSNSCTLSVNATVTDDKYPDVPYWELLMPGHKMVRFGPGDAWSLKCSDLPM